MSKRTRSGAIFAEEEPKAKKPDKKWDSKQQKDFDNMKREIERLKMDLAQVTNQSQNNFNLSVTVNDDLTALKAANLDAIQIMIESLDKSADEVGDLDSALAELKRIVDETKAKQHATFEANKELQQTISGIMERRTAAIIVAGAAHGIVNAAQRAHIAVLEKEPFSRAVRNYINAVKGILNADITQHVSDQDKLETLLVSMETNLTKLAEGLKIAETLKQDLALALPQLPAFLSQLYQQLLGACAVVTYAPSDVIEQQKTNLPGELNKLVRGLFEKGIFKNTLTALRTRQINARDDPALFNAKKDAISQWKTIVEEMNKVFVFQNLKDAIDPLKAEYVDFTIVEIKYWTTTERIEKEREIVLQLIANFWQKYNQDANIATADFTNLAHYVELVRNTPEYVTLLKHLSSDFGKDLKRKIAGNEIIVEFVEFSDKMEALKLNIDFGAVRTSAKKQDLSKQLTHYAAQSRNFSVWTGIEYAGQKLGFYKAENALELKYIKGTKFFYGQEQQNALPIFSLDYLQFEPFILNLKNGDEINFDFISKIQSFLEKSNSGICTLIANIVFSYVRTVCNFAVETLSAYLRGLSEDNVRLSAAQLSSLYLNVVKALDDVTSKLSKMHQSNTPLTIPELLAQFNLCQTRIRSICPVVTAFKDTVKFLKEKEEDSTLTIEDKISVLNIQEPTTGGSLQIAAPSKGSPVFNAIRIKLIQDLLNTIAAATLAVSLAWVFSESNSTSSGFSSESDEYFIIMKQSGWYGLWAFLNRCLTGALEVDMIGLLCFTASDYFDPNKDKETRNKLRNKQYSQKRMRVFTGMFIVDTLLIFLNCSEAEDHSLFKIEASNKLLDSVKGFRDCMATPSVDILNMPDDNKFVKHCQKLVRLMQAEGLVAYKATEDYKRIACYRQAKLTEYSKTEADLLKAKFTVEQLIFVQAHRYSLYGEFIMAVMRWYQATERSNYQVSKTARRISVTDVALNTPSLSLTGFMGFKMDEDYWPRLLDDLYINVTRWKRGEEAQKLRVITFAVTVTFGLAKNYYVQFGLLAAAGAVYSSVTPAADQNMLDTHIALQENPPFLRNGRYWSADWNVHGKDYFTYKLTHSTTSKISFYVGLQPVLTMNPLEATARVVGYENEYPFELSKAGELNLLASGLNDTIHFAPVLGTLIREYTFGLETKSVVEQWKASVANAIFSWTATAVGWVLPTTPAMGLGALITGVGWAVGQMYSVRAFALQEKLRMLDAIKKVVTSKIAQSMLEEQMKTSKHWIVAVFDAVCPTKAQVFCYSFAGTHGVVFYLTGRLIYAIILTTRPDNIRVDTWSSKNVALWKQFS